MNLLSWLILIITVERITEIIVDSELLKPFRELIKRFIYKEDRPPEDDIRYTLLTRLDYLVNCGYCVSVWVGLCISAIVSQSVQIPIENTYVKWFIIGIFLHGSSNAYHVIYSRILKGRIFTLDIMMNHNVNLSKKNGEDSITDE